MYYHRETNYRLQGTATFGLEEHRFEVRAHLIDRCRDRWQVSVHASWPVLVGHASGPPSKFLRWAAEEAFPGAEIKLRHPVRLTREGRVVQKEFI